MNRNTWAAITGLVFAVTLVFGAFLAFDSPDADESDQAFIDWYGDSSHQQENIIGAYMLTVSGIAFSLFAITGVRPRLLAHSRNDDDRTLASASPALALVASALFIAGAFPIAAPSALGAFNSNVQVDPGAARLMPQIGFGMILVGGAITSAAFIAVTSVHALRTGSLARWLGWLGLICAVVLLFGVIFLPMAALPIWVIAAAVSFFGSPQPAGQAVPA